MELQNRLEGDGVTTKDIRRSDIRSVSPRHGVFIIGSVNSQVMYEG